jgi:integrase
MESTLPATYTDTLPTILRTVGDLDHVDRAAAARPLGLVVAATMQAAARSVHTRRAYTTGIGYFLTFLDATVGDQVPVDWRPFAQAGKETDVVRGRTVTRTVWAYNGPAAVLRLVDAGTLDAFRAWRESEGDSANTASKHVAAVRTFLAVAYRDHAIGTETAQRMGLRPYVQRQKRDRKPVGRRLTRDEVKALRESVNRETAKGKRDAAILDLALYGALRAQELATIRLTDFVQDQGRWWVQVVGKGEKTRRFKLADPAFVSLDAWLQVAGLRLGAEGRVFVSVNKGDAIGAIPVNTSTIGRLVAEYGAKAGLAPEAGPSRLSPHDLRRTAARAAYDGGAPLLLVQRWLGHADPSTTAHYIGLDDEDGASAVDFLRY